MMTGHRTTTQQVRAVLMGYISSITAESILKGALLRVRRSASELDRDGLDEPTVAALGRGVAVFLGSDTLQRECTAKLSALTTPHDDPQRRAPLEIPIDHETSVVDARVKARSFARELGFDRTDQARIATTVSELARNIFSYARAGRVSLGVVREPRPGLRIVATDAGSGIPNLSAILAGNYRSRTGMGLGILACKRLMDEFSITSTPRGTTVIVIKHIP